MSKLQGFLSRLRGGGGGGGKGKGEEDASLPSRWLFRYANPLLREGAHRRLEAPADALPLAEKRRMNHVVPRLQQQYVIQQRLAKNNSSSSGKKMKPSTVLLKALVRDQQRTLLLTGVLRFINTAIQAFPSLLIARLLRLMESGAPPSQSLLAAISLVSLLSVKMIVENSYFHNAVKMSTEVRGAVAGLIFDKSLKVAASGTTAAESSKKDEDDQDGDEKEKGEEEDDEENASSSQKSTGGVINLMQTDASILESSTLQIHTVWDGILQILMYSGLLFRFLGPSVVWGMMVLLFMIPFNSLALRVLGRLNKYENEARDARTKRTAEAISNMKLLKLQGWEGIFAQDISGHRRDELTRHSRRGIVRALNIAVSNAVPAIVLAVTLTAYSRTGRPMVASTIFTAISLFNQLRFPLFFYPYVIDSLANGRNALKRVASYLSQEEVVPYVQELPASSSFARGSGSLEMSHGNFLWSLPPRNEEGETTSEVKPALCNAALSVQPGEVVAVVGPVGSGKTALVKALLGELAPVPRAVVDDQPAKDGDSDDAMKPATVIRRGAVAYCAQESWLSKGTLRDAVVFGRPYDEARYMQALYDAGLDKDVSNDDGDAGGNGNGGKAVLTHDTDVGEGGSSLSGGQRARVALARALYASTDAGVYLLDDPLSALDASVGSTVFSRLTSRLRRQDAATVFVTNDPSLPRQCDRVVLMAPGASCPRILNVGTYEELVARGHDLLSFDAPDDDDDDGAVAVEIAVDTIPEETPAPPIQVDARATTTTIRIVGGYDAGRNDTDFTSCHADPDSDTVFKHDQHCVADKSIPHSPPNVNVRCTEIDLAACRQTLETNEAGGDSTTTTTTSESSTTPGRPKEATEAAASSVSAVTTPKKAAPKKLESTDDKMTVGAVPRETYFTYLKAVKSPLLIFAMIASILASNGARFYQQDIVRKLTDAGTVAAGFAAFDSVGARRLRLLVRSASVYSVVLWIQHFVTMRVGVQASEFLHRRMLASVVSSPISFFDATPSGQLLSRFGKEMETVDRALPDGISNLMFCLLTMSFSIATIAGVVSPAMLIPFGVIGILYSRTMARFRPAARDMKRGESKTRAPIYTHFGEALKGVETIRSVPLGTKLWSAQHQALANDNLATYSSVKVLDRWLSVRLESLGNVLVMACALASVLLASQGRLKSGSAGWGITQAVSMTGLMAWTVRVLTDLETYMMSVVRISEVTDLGTTTSSENTRRRGRRKRRRRRSVQGSSNMPKELSEAGEALSALGESSQNLSPAPLSDEALLASGWPWKGEITFENVSMRYNPQTPLVLKNVTLDVPPGSTLGVVGRTGSGKSSLLLTLFRLVELDLGDGESVVPTTSGIFIDGVDIRSVRLQTLRQSLAIIPQDPVLFAGTVLSNLDATGTVSHKDAWQALEAASPALAQQFQTTGLETPITEGGKNLSVGQRQLMCLARALVRKSKILLLDEATSSVDSTTDAQVQETIRREFVQRGVTVLTVAHRLETVLGYDKIAVLGQGELLEWGPPSTLLQQPEGELRKLVLAQKASLSTNRSTTTTNLLAPSREEETQGSSSSSSSSPQAIPTP